MCADNAVVRLCSKLHQLLYLAADRVVSCRQWSSGHLCRGAAEHSRLQAGAVQSVNTEDRSSQDTTCHHHRGGLCLQIGLIILPVRRWCQ